MQWVFSDDTELVMGETSHKVCLLVKFTFEMDVEILNIWLLYHCVAMENVIYLNNTYYLDKTYYLYRYTQLLP